MELASTGQLLGVVAVTAAIFWALLRSHRRGDPLRQRWSDYFAQALDQPSLRAATPLRVDLPVLPGGCGLWLDAPGALRVALQLRLIRDGQVIEELPLALFGNLEDGGDSPLGGVRTWPWAAAPERCASLLCRRDPGDVAGSLVAELTWTPRDPAGPAELRLLLTPLPHP